MGNKTKGRSKAFREGNASGHKIGETVNTAGVPFGLAPTTNDKSNGEDSYLRRTQWDEIARQMIMGVHPLQIREKLGLHAQTLRTLA